MIPSSVRRLSWQSARSHEGQPRWASHSRSVSCIAQSRPSILIGPLPPPRRLPRPRARITLSSPRIRRSYMASVSAESRPQLAPDVVGSALPGAIVLARHRQWPDPNTTRDAPNWQFI